MSQPNDTIQMRSEIQAALSLSYAAKELLLFSQQDEKARATAHRILAMVDQLVEGMSPAQLGAPADPVLVGSEREAEQRSLESSFTAPSVTQDQINALLVRVTYRYEQPEGTTVTFAHAFLDGDFHLATGFSACVSPANFNKATGEKYAGRQALEKAAGKLWELEGYALRKSLREPRCSGSVIGHTPEAR